MTGRDRIVVIGVVMLVVLGAAWMLVVSPEREKASKLSAEVSAAQATLSSAEGKLASARTAQSQYAAAYASLVNVGKAVPPTAEVPALIDQLTRASHEKNVEFSSITASSSGGSASSASASAAGSASAGLSQQPFTFVFEGSFFDLEHLFQQLTDFATLTPTGQLQVSGRLLTIQSVKLSPADSSASADGKSASDKLTGTITASAYVLPASEPLTATATSPTGSATPASSTGAAASSPTAPAIVSVNP